MPGGASPAQLHERPRPGCRDVREGERAPTPHGPQQRRRTRWPSCSKRATVIRPTRVRARVAAAAARTTRSAGRACEAISTPSAQAHDVRCAPLNETHDPQLTAGSPRPTRRAPTFPIQNLPFGVFRRARQSEALPRRRGDRRPDPRPGGCCTALGAASRRAAPMPRSLHAGRR